MWKNNYPGQSWHDTTRRCTLQYDDIRDISNFSDFFYMGWITWTGLYCFFGYSYVLILPHGLSLWLEPCFTQLRVLLGGCIETPHLLLFWNKWKKIIKFFTLLKSMMEEPVCRPLFRFTCCFTSLPFFLISITTNFQLGLTVTEDTFPSTTYGRFWEPTAAWDSIWSLYLSLCLSVCLSLSLLLFFLLPLDP